MSRRSLGPGLRTIIVDVLGSHNFRPIVTSALCALTACAHVEAGGATSWPTLADRSPEPTQGHPSDSQPGQDGSVSLQGILAYADRHSPILSVARARSGQGDAEIAAAEVLLQNNPELRSSLGPRVNRAGTGIDVEVSLEQRFEIAGERGLRIQAAQRLRDLGRLELEEVRWLIHRQVHATFHAGLVARERVAAATKVLEFTERMLEIARRRKAAGDISVLDVRVAETELAQARQTKIAAEAAYRAARLLLAELAGWPAESAPEPTGTLDEPRRTPPPARLVELARQNNPALHTHGQAVQAADARVDLADREAWPEPSIGVSYARESEPGGPSGSETHIGLVTLGLPIPIWQRNQGDRARARADAVVARAEREALQRTLGAQVSRSADAVNAAAARVAAYGTEIIPEFEKNLELLRRAFELGEMDLLELMVARGRFLEVERDALTAYGDYYDAVANLEELVGAELWPDEHDHSERPAEVHP